jgi:hypothetical protein
MIRYALRCARGHDFDSWFASASAFDALSDNGLVACAICGTTEVAKALMAPKVAGDRPASPLSAPASPMEAKVAALRAKIEAGSTYVGPRFAEEARRIHAGAEPEAPIWGEANAAEAKALIEDGIPVAPLPFVPRKSLI